MRVAAPRDDPVDARAVPVLGVDGPQHLEHAGPFRVGAGRVVRRPERRPERLGSRCVRSRSTHCVLAISWKRCASPSCVRSGWVKVWLPIHIPARRSSRTSAGRSRALSPLVEHRRPQVLLLQRPQQVGRRQGWARRRRSGRRRRCGRGAGGARRRGRSRRARGARPPGWPRGRRSPAPPGRRPRCGRGAAADLGVRPVLHGSPARAGGADGPRPAPGGRLRADEDQRPRTRLRGPAAYAAALASTGTSSSGRTGPGGVPSPKGRPPSSSRWCGVSQPARSGPLGTICVGLMSLWTT